MDLTRQAQEANVRAYRERAAFEEKRKKTAAPLPTDARAALDRLFSLDADAVRMGLLSEDGAPVVDQAVTLEEFSAAC